MRIEEMLKDHIRRMEDAMLEDVIKPLRGIVNVWKQEIENTSTTSRFSDKQSRRFKSNITELVGRKPKKTRKTKCRNTAP